MSTDRIRVSRKLYCAALADAIDWTETLIQAGHPKPEDIQRLANYRRAFAAISAPRRPEPTERTITLADLSARGDTGWPA